jgi:hypothetical protein
MAMLALKAGVKKLCLAVKSTEELIARSWWVVLFILGCYFCYEQGLKKRDQDFAKLHQQHLDLLKEKKIAAIRQEQLALQLSSQNDPEWVELMLMKGLGLVPEGQIKVLFTEQQELLGK